MDEVEEMAVNVDNLQKLYRVGQKILSDRRPFGFGRWLPTQHECGTFCCFAGNYWIENDIDITKEAAEMTLTVWLDDHFGTSRDKSVALFDAAGGPADRPGPEAYVELERRMEFLAGLIREAGGTVPGEKTKHVGLPASVREIFEEATCQSKP
jgi:hypothetical protein